MYSGFLGGDLLFFSAWIVIDHWRGLNLFINGFVMIVSIGVN
jgi:hypothetical protein